MISSVTSYPPLKGWDFCLDDLFFQCRPMQVNPKTICFEVWFVNSSVNPASRPKSKGHTERFYLKKEDNTYTLCSKSRKDEYKLSSPFEESLIDACLQFGKQYSLRPTSLVSPNLKPLRALSKIIGALTEFANTKATLSLKTEYDVFELKFYEYENTELNFTIRMAVPTSESYFKIPFLMKNANRRKANPNFKLTFTFTISAKHLPEVVLCSEEDFALLSIGGEYRIAQSITQAIAMRGMLTLR